MTLPPATDTSHFFRGALLIMGATLVSASFGLVFWIVAARVLSETEVGRDGTLVASLTALAGAAQVNLAATLPRFLPQLRDQARRVVLTAFGVCSLVALALATVLFADRLFAHGVARCRRR